MSFVWAGRERGWEGKGGRRGAGGVGRGRGGAGGGARAQHSRTHALLHNRAIRNVEHNQPLANRGNEQRTIRAEG